MKKHAYLIMAHSDFESLKYLLKAIDDERNDIFIHIDLKTKYADFQEIATWVEKSSIHFIKRINVRWGHTSFVKCELSLIEAAVKNDRYHYYHLISGVDFPLKSQDEIHKFFEDKNLEYLNYHFDGDNGDEFTYKIKYYHFFMRWIGRGHFDGPGKKQAFLRKLKEYNWKLINKQEQRGFDRRTKYPDVEFVKGDNWVSITDDFARYVVQSKKKIMKMYAFANAPDEFFMATLAYNSNFKDRIANNTMRLIDWERGNPYEFVYSDFEELKNTDKLFARKISYVNQPMLVRALMAHIEKKEAVKDENNPLVSIVVPIYNVKQYLNECLDSLAKQTYSNIEVLLINDGSTDESGDMAREYTKKDSRFKYFSQHNQGLSAARNTGLENAKGDYIAVVDSDDWVEPDYIEVMLDEAKRTDADVTVCGVLKECKPQKLIKIEGGKVFSKTSAMRVLGNIFTDEYLALNVAWNKLYKKKIFDKVCYAVGKLHEDEYTIHHIINEADLIASVEKPLYHYRVREDSITGTQQSNNLRHFDIIDAHRDRVKSCKNQLYGSFYRLIVYSLFEEIIWQIPTYSDEFYKEHNLNHRFRRIMLGECIKNISYLDKVQIKEYISVILNPRKYIQKKI